MSDKNNNDELEMDYSPDILTLVDEEGVEQEFELLDVIEVDDQRYFAFLPYYEDAQKALESDAELVVLKSEMVDGEEMLASIDDDDEYDRIGNMFLEKLADMFEEDFEEFSGELQ